MGQLIIQPSGADTYLSEQNPTTNYSAVTLLMAGRNPGLRGRAIFRFDFSALPAGCVIEKAVLSLYVDSVSTGGDYGIYELTRTDWIETQATWNIYKTGSNWTAAGGDYISDRKAVKNIIATGWAEWDVKALCEHFQSAHNEIANILLKWELENNDYFIYVRSEDHLTESTRPKLVIDYQEIGGGSPQVFYRRRRR
jgi:hypothetical protein